jgi:hypothetical protein
MSRSRAVEKRRRAVWHIDVRVGARHITFGNRPGRMAALAQWSITNKAASRQAGAVGKYSHGSSEFEVVSEEDFWKRVGFADKS